MGDISHTTGRRKKKSWLMNHWGQMDPRKDDVTVDLPVPSGKGHRNRGFKHQKWWICPSFFVNVYQAGYLSMERRVNFG